MKILKKSSSGPSGNVIILERTKTKNETNQSSKRCRLAIMSTIWIATLIPSNIIAAIFFFKTQNSNFMEIRDSTVLSFDSHNELPHVTEENRKNASSDEEDEEKPTFIKIPKTEENLDNYINHSSALFHSPNNTMETQFFNCYEKIHVLHHLREDLWYWLEGVFLFVFGTLGLVMNILAIIILKNCPDDTSFSVLLIYLAVWDTALIVDMMADKLLSYYFEDPLWFNVTYPFFWHPIKGVCLIATTFMIVAVSIERYRAICRPFVTRQSPHWYAGIVLLSALIIKLPRFFHFELDENGTDYHTSKMYEDLDYIKISAYWDDLFITGILPIFTVAFLNLQTYLHIKKSLQLKKRKISTRNCCLRINRPSIQARTLSLKLNTGGGSNNGNIPIIALNGNIIDTESFEKEHLNPLSVYSKTNFDNNSECSTEDGQKKVQLNAQLKTSSLDHFKKTEAYCPRQQSLQKSLSDDNVCLEYQNKVVENKCPPSKNKTLEEEEAARMIDSRKVYLEKKMLDNIEPPSKENTRLVLPAIVFLFILTHSFRLAFKMYEILLPRGNTADHFEQCYRIGRHHVPFVLYILLLLNNLFVVLNSSLNFIVYCCVSKSFRDRTLCMIQSKLSAKKALFIRN